MTTLIVRNNTTKEEITRECSSNMPGMYARIETLRRKYKNSTVELYYGMVNDEPVSQYKSFDCLSYDSLTW